MRTETDQELLDSYVASGDESAFAELAARYGPMAYRTCRRVLGNDHDAEDATQAAFLVLARKAGQLRRKGRMNGWLHRVARLTALEALRKRAGAEQRAAQAAFWQENLPEDVSEADREALLRHVDAELDGLSGALREAVVLRYLRGFGEREAAVQAGCPLGTMKRRASEGLAQLRKRLAKRGVALGASALAASLAREASAAVPETLLPSLLATVQSVAPAAGAAAGASTTAAMLAEGAMKTMFWNGVRTACLVAASAGAVAVGGVAAVQVATEKPEPAPAAEMAAPAEPEPATEQAATDATVTPRGYSFSSHFQAGSAWMAIPSCSMRLFIKRNDEVVFGSEILRRRNERFAFAFERCRMRHAHANLNGHNRLAVVVGNEEIDFLASAASKIIAHSPILPSQTQVDHVFQRARIGAVPDQAVADGQRPVNTVDLPTCFETDY